MLDKIIIVMWIILSGLDFYAAITRIDWVWAFLGVISLGIAYYDFKKYKIKTSKDKIYVKSEF